MKERGHDLEFEVLFVPVAVGPALEDADLVVEPLDQAEADLVFGVFADHSGSFFAFRANG